MSTANPATSNTDGVKQQDRQAVGNQPDNTPVGPSGVSAGGGAPPTGPAGGDLAGSYPSPTLKVIGSAAGPVGDSTHVAAVTVDAKGRVTGLAAVAIAVSGLPAGGAKFQRLAKNSATSGDAGWYGPDNFNVLDYIQAAAGNVTNGINAAIAALNAAGGGTLRIPYNPADPNGQYALTGALTTITVPCAIIGDGRNSSSQGCTTIISAANTTVMKITTPSPCLIANVGFYGGGTQPTFILTGATPGTDFNAGSCIRECSFSSGTKGIYADAAFITIRDCTISGSVYGIDATNSVNLDELFGTINACALGGGTACIHATADGLRITECDMNSGTDGVLLTNTAGNTFADVWIAFNHMEGVTGTGVRMDGSAAGSLFTNIIIVGNEIKGPTTSIQTDSPGPSANPAFVNLTITGNMFGSYSTGVNLFKCDCVSVGNNVFEAGGGSTGINVDASCGTNGAVFGNVARGGTTLLVNTGGFAVAGSGANPSASVGLTAVNGSAATFMRSDAAPPIDQSIAPNWSGTHAFTVPPLIAYYNVASLPAALKGARAHALDALGPVFGSIVVGGGALMVPVYNDGTNWRVG